ncbi:hypothetical protein OKW40_000647 [Paraburkholderia sp. RAU6.4a]
MCVAYLGRGPPHSTLGCCGIRTQWGYCPIFLVIVVVWSVEQVRGLNVERAHCPGLRVQRIHESPESTVTVAGCRCRMNNPPSRFGRLRALTMTAPFVRACMRLPFKAYRQLTILRR